MEIDRILVSVGPGQTRIAATSKGQLVGLNFERAEQRNMVGDIFVGRVKTVVNSLQAAFVDIGEDVSGFLELAEARPYSSKSKDSITDYVVEGDLILVQVTRNAEGKKGAKLTLKPVLTGRNLIFIPGQSGISVSNRIKNSEIRDRLKDTLARRKNTSGGFIIRTVAEESQTSVLLTEAARLENKWTEILSASHAIRRPKILMQEVPSVQRLLRDVNLANLNVVLTDDIENYNQLMTYITNEIPNISDLVHLHRGKESLFHAEGIEEMIDAALDPLVELPNGGNIKITETDALVAVDVNTGGAAGNNRDQMILSVNCTAAKVFARHMQLRNLSGLIVIDFVTMRNTKHQKNVLETFRKAVADDPQQPFIGGFTKFGLLEMTRRRRGPSLSASLCEKSSGPEKSLVTAGLDALREILEEAFLAPASHFSLRVSEEMLRIFENDLATALKDVENKIGGRLKLKSFPAIKPNTYLIQSKPGSSHE